MHCDLCVEWKGELMNREDARQEDTIDLGRLLSIVIVRKKVVVCIVAVCTAIAAMVSVTLPKEYTSQATVQVVDCDMGLGKPAGTAGINISTDMELAKSNEVLKTVIEQVFTDLNPEDRPNVENFVKKYLEVTNPKGTRIIKIVARGRTPQDAKYIAENVSANFVKIKAKSNEDKKSVVVAAFDESIKNAVKESDEATAAMGKYIAEYGNNTDALEYQRLIREVEAKKAAYEALVVQAEQAKIQQSGNVIQLVDAANMPDENNPSGPKRKLIIAIGFVIGCMIALGYGLLLYKKDA